MARQPQRAEQRPDEDEIVFFEDRGDKFNVPEDLIPEGFTYQWCRAYYTGKPDQRNLSILQRNYWQFVPADRAGHEVLGGESTRPSANGEKHPYEGCVVLDGMVLMERPTKIQEKAVAMQKQRAKDQVRNQILSLNLAPKGTLGDDQGKRVVTLQRDRDLSIPEDYGEDT